MGFDSSLTIEINDVWNFEEYFFLWIFFCLSAFHQKMLFYLAISGYEPYMAYPILNIGMLPRKKKKCYEEPHTHARVLYGKTVVKHSVTTRLFVFLLHIKWSVRLADCEQTQNI